MEMAAMANEREREKATKHLSLVDDMKTVYLNQTTAVDGVRPSHFHCILHKIQIYMFLSSTRLFYWKMTIVQHVECHIHHRHQIVLFDISSRKSCENFTQKNTVLVSISDLFCRMKKRTPNKNQDTCKFHCKCDIKFTLQRLQWNAIGKISHVTTRAKKNLKMKIDKCEIIFIFNFVVISWPFPRPLCRFAFKHWDARHFANVDEKSTDLKNCACSTFVQNYTEILTEIFIGL